MRLYVSVFLGAASALAAGAIGCSGEGDSSGGDRNRIPAVPDPTGMPSSDGDSGDSGDSGDPGFGNPTDNLMDGTAGGGAVMPVDMRDDGSCSASGAEAEVGLESADLIWVVDNSCSMTEEAAAVQANMNRFATMLFDMGIDVRLTLISTTSLGDPNMSCPPGDLICTLLAGNELGLGVCIDAPFGSGMCPEDSNPPQFLHLDENVNSINALQRVMDLYPQYAHNLRPDSKKHFVVVTDDNSSVPAATFSQWVDNVDPSLFGNGWFFHGVYAKTQCPGAQIGTVYEELANQTSGIASDLCLQQFDPVFDALAVDVVGKADFACDWPIPPPPAGQVLDKELVNVEYTQPDGVKVALAKIPEGEECNGREGWFYDDELAPTQVRSCPVACERFQSVGGKVDVLFGCVTQVVR